MSHCNGCHSTRGFLCFFSSILSIALAGFYFSCILHIKKISVRALNWGSTLYALKFPSKPPLERIRPQSEICPHLITFLLLFFCLHNSLSRTFDFLLWSTWLWRDRRALRLRLTHNCVPTRTPYTCRNGGTSDCLFGKYTCVDLNVMWCVGADMGLAYLK